MADLATDDFNRADGGLGANWTTITGMTAPTIATNKVNAGILSTPESEALYTAIAWPDDQYAYATCTSSFAFLEIPGIILRGITGAQTCYLAYVKGPFGASAVLGVQRRNAGIATQLYTETTKTFTSGQVLKFEIIGSTLRVYFDGVDQTGDINDGTPLTSGSPGIFLYSNDAIITNPKIDDWGGGTAATTITGLRPAICL